MSGPTKEKIMHIINNTLVIEDFQWHEIDERYRGYLRQHFKDPSEFSYINTRRELEEILQVVPLESAVKLINMELGDSSAEVIIKKQAEMNAFIAHFKGIGMHDGGSSIASILISINKTYCNLSSAEKIARYLKALGFGLHRELSEEE